MRSAHQRRGVPLAWRMPTLPADVPSLTLAVSVSGFGGLGLRARLGGLVLLTRLGAALRVLVRPFAGSLVRRKHHDHVAPVLLGFRLDETELGQILGKPLQ